MHIPDGYLSPSTCACLYGASAPFWYSSLRQIKANISSRSVPLLSVFAAFSFVVMMFNLPLPGGTTGHAVGMGIATVVLGPAVSVVAISSALLIQALFFGDGGITAFGANCFNMAIVGSFAAHGVFRLLSWRAEPLSQRRVLAAGLAGYVAINLSAFLAAIEFGIQPMLFRDASGAPLYAPYPLSVSIPAMMIGHLTIAGFAEFVLSAGLVAYLQRSNPELLAIGPSASRRSFKGLWVTLAALLLLTPLGILAVGSAWGEWSPQEVGSPQGMTRLHSLWNAPLAGYAPSFVASASAGYFVSALFGVGLVVLLSYCLKRLFPRRPLIETSIHHFVRVFDRAFFAEDVASSKGYLQSVDPRVKLIGFILLLFVSLATHRLSVLVAIVVAAAAAAGISRVSLSGSLLRTWLAVLAFTGLIALPAVVLTGGTVVYRLPILHWGVTNRGLRAAAFLILRSEAAATLCLLLIQTTLWNSLLRAFRSLRIPSTPVVLLAMTYRYLFVFLQAAQSMLESRQTKLIGSMSGSDHRRMATASVGVLFDKSIQLSSEVHAAMQARGFRGEVYVLEDAAMGTREWLQIAAMVLLCAATLVWGFE